MSLSAFAKDYAARTFGQAANALDETDPEFADFWKNFAFDEVVNAGAYQDVAPLDDQTRFVAILAATLGCQALDAFKFVARAALNVGLEPVAFKEIVYQATAYLGLARTLPFIVAANDLLRERGVELPLPPQGKTTRENRIGVGNQIQIEFFGEGMRETWKKAQPGRANINLWLAGNCFGDYYSRDGLDARRREMITFCFLAAQGGCEPQLVGHAIGNMRVGNSKEFLFQVVEQCVPYVGYPRSLNALAAIDKAVAQMQSQG